MGLKEKKSQYVIRNNQATTYFTQRLFFFSFFCFAKPRIILVCTIPIQIQFLANCGYWKAENFKPWTKIGRMQINSWYWSQNTNLQSV